MLAVALAFASHFVLDALPHFGIHTWPERHKQAKLFRGSIIIDVIGTLLILTLFWYHHAPALAYVCGFVAMAPDIVWWYRYAIPEKWGTRPPGPMNWFNNWHRDIQTRESVHPGALIEIAFLASCSIYVISQLT